MSLAGMLRPASTSTLTFKKEKYSLRSLQLVLSTAHQSPWVGQNQAVEEHWTPVLHAVLNNR